MSNDDVIPGDDGASGRPSRSPLIYSEPPAATVDDVRRRLRDGCEPAVIAEALIGAALNSTDRRGVEAVCLELLGTGGPSLAAVAATALGHLARLHGTLSLDQVLPALARARSDPQVRGYVDTALDDMAMFLDLPRQGLLQTPGADTPAPPNRPSRPPRRTQRP